MDNYFYYMPGKIEAEKYSYGIEGCKFLFSAYDETKVSDVETKNAIGHVEDYDDHGNILVQHIMLNIPKGIFKADLQYVCIKQNADTSLHVVREEDLSEGDTACRIFFPQGHFINIRDMCRPSHDDNSEPIENYAFVALNLIPNNFLCLEPV